MIEQYEERIETPKRRRRSETSEAETDDRFLFWRRFWSHPGVYVALAILLFFTILAIFAERITPGVTPQTSFLLRIHPALGPSGPTGEAFPSRILGNIAFDDFDGSRRSVLTEITFGARASLLVCLGSTFFASIIGVTLGACSGYFGGWLDALMMRVIDIISSIPFLALIAFIVILAPFPVGSVGTLVLLFSLFGWTEIARGTRAKFILLRQETFTEAAQAQGVATWRILIRHLLPNAMATISTLVAATAALFLITEATLDFLSLGVVTQMTWGFAFDTAFADVLTASWWAILFPGLAIVLTVIAVNLLGDALRDTYAIRDTNS